MVPHTTQGCILILFQLGRVIEHSGMSLSSLLKFTTTRQSKVLSHKPWSPDPFRGSLICIHYPFLHVDFSCEGVHEIDTFPSLSFQYRIWPFVISRRSISHRYSVPPTKNLKSVFSTGSQNRTKRKDPGSAVTRDTGRERRGGHGWIQRGNEQEWGKYNESLTITVKVLRVVGVCTPVTFLPYSRFRFYRSLDGDTTSTPGLTGLL